MFSMFAKLSQYMREVGQEMHRVSWPTLAELKESTTVVIVTVAVVTFFVFVVDQVLSFVQKKLILMS
jgi:preprotein translocase subunit SecE